MLEKIGAVSNPLTIIAIFAALAEVAGTVALAVVDKELQQVFVWFVMGFPVLLVILFFATLNFNPMVLYAPSDFRDEENFLGMLVGTRSLSIDLKEVARQLEEARETILSGAAEDIAQLGASEREKLSRILDLQLQQIEARIETVREAAEEMAAGASDAAYPRSDLQARIVQYVSSNPGASAVAISDHVHSNFNATARALRRLLARGLIVSEGKFGDSYRLARSGNDAGSASSA